MVQIPINQSKTTVSFFNSKLFRDPFIQMVGFHYGNSGEGLNAFRDDSTTKRLYQNK